MQVTAAYNKRWTLFIVFFMGMGVLCSSDAVALSCDRPDPTAYEKVFRGKVLETANLGSLVDKLFKHNTNYKARIAVLEVFKGDVGEVEEVSYTLNPTWGPDLSVGKETWIYANNNSIGLCDYGVSPK